MAAIGIETIPSTWDDERDTAFFRIAAHLFSCEFTYGAGVLLASYDDEFEATAPDAATTAATTSSVPAQFTAGHVTAL